MNRSLLETAINWDELLASVVNIVDATVASNGNPNSSVSFSYKIGDRSYAGTGIALTAYTPGTVAALRTEDGEWYVVGRNFRQRVQQNITVLRRARPSKTTVGSIQVLYAVYNSDDSLDLFVGGDRPTPRKIAHLPPGNDVRRAGINNLGRQEFIVGASYSDQDGFTDPRSSSVIGVSRSAYQITYAQDSRVTGFSTSLATYLGYGFWIAENRHPQSGPYGLTWYLTSPEPVFSLALHNGKIYQTPSNLTNPTFFALPPATEDEPPFSIQATAQGLRSAEDGLINRQGTALLTPAPNGYRLTTRNGSTLVSPPAGESIDDYQITSGNTNFIGDKFYQVVQTSQNYFTRNDTLKIKVFTILDDRIHRLQDKSEKIYSIRNKAAIVLALSYYPNR